MTNRHDALIAAAERMIRPHRVGDRLFGDVGATLVAVWRNKTGDLHVLPPCGRCREFIRQIDPANLDTEIVLGRHRSASLRELLPEHQWPEALDRPHLIDSVATPVDPGTADGPG